MIPGKSVGWSVCAAVVCLGVFFSAAAPAMGQTFTASQFDVEGWIGQTLRMDTAGTETEHRIWLGEDPVVTPWSETRYARFEPSIEVIDGVVTNAVFVFDGDVAGPPDYEGEPWILSNTEGAVQFHDHPLDGDGREHAIGGATLVPPTMNVGDSFVDARCTTWEGQGDPNDEWTGTYERTFTIVGPEAITLPTGVVDALRIDIVDDRTKTGLSGNLWATEYWESSIWLVEGVGLVKSVGSEEKFHYDISFDGGNSPMSAYSSYEETYITIVPEPAILPGDSDSDGDVDAGDLAVVGLHWSPGATDKTWEQGDFDGDGMVGPEDLALLGLNWSPGGYTSIPEPATLGLLALGGVALIRRRKA